MLCVASQEHIGGIRRLYRGCIGDDLKGLFLGLYRDRCPDNGDSHGMDMEHALI